MGFFLSLLIGAALMVVSYLLMPKPKMPQREIEQGEKPTAEAGRPVEVLFGTLTVKAPNCLGYWDKYYKKKEISV